MSEFYSLPYQPQVSAFHPTSAFQPPRRAPVTIIYQAEEPPKPETPLIDVEAVDSPPPPPVKARRDAEKRFIEADEESEREENTPSPKSSSKRRKYTLKNDLERNDKSYKELRMKNNESVRRTREKKRQEEDDARQKVREETAALKDIVKFMIQRQAYLEQMNNFLKNQTRVPPPPVDGQSMLGTLGDLPLRLYNEIRGDIIKNGPLSGLTVTEPHLFDPSF